MELGLICAMLGAAWFWLDSLHKRDIAVTLGRQAAERYGLQFLDETVAISKLWTARDGTGRLRLQRTYTFEVSDTGTNRLACTLVLLGSQLQSLEIPPYRDSNVIPLRFH
ncbi:MAG: DUF3301 domain-containing protein [Methylophilaceae bacterium]|nr:DUF3301 domain-containing protein [Methylophilaceae bacterium]